MNQSGPFTPGDLAELDYLYRKADRVIAMDDVFRGDVAPEAIAVRHDVDDNTGSLDTALRMAEWEEARGYRTTYYLLHDAHYWADAPDAARDLDRLGHEVGIHVNAISVALRYKRNPHFVLLEALHHLRKAVDVIGMVAHGDQPICRDVGFVNDEHFMECARPDKGSPTRTLEYEGYSLAINPVSMWEYGIKYDANWLSRGEYMSDSGNQWSRPFWDVADRFPTSGQLHLLTHPDWWGSALTKVQVAA